MLSWGETVEEAAVLSNAVIYHCGDGGRRKATTSVAEDCFSITRLQNLGSYKLFTPPSQKHLPRNILLQLIIQRFKYYYLIF